MNNTVWHPIKGYENYAINRHGKIKNRKGNILKLQSQPASCIQLQKDKEQHHLKIIDLYREVFNKPALSGTYLTFDEGNFFNHISVKKSRDNYSLEEVIFELEIKQKKVS